MNLQEKENFHFIFLVSRVQWLAAGRWFSPGTPVSSTNKTDHYDIAELWLKVVLDTIALTPNTLLTRNMKWKFSFSCRFMIGTDCIGSYKSNYHTITTTMAPLSSELS
jgi:hypothetical protein